MLQEFQISNFVESGTGDGSSMDKVLLTEVVDNSYGVELDDELYANLEKKYKGLDYVHLYKGYTEDRFDEVLSKLDGSPTLWWTMHTSLVQTMVMLDMVQKKTLTSVFLWKKNSKSWFKIEIFPTILSSWMIFVSMLIVILLLVGPQRKLYGADGYDFVEQLIGDTHILIEHHGDQGYLLAFPVDTPEDKIRGVINEI